VDRSTPVIFSRLGHFESSMYIDRPVPQPRSVANLGGVRTAVEVVVYVVWV
jgi:hypothetical protein